jgi:FkbM family methyltransferase
MKNWSEARNRLAYAVDQLHWKVAAKAAARYLGYNVARADPVVRSDGGREDPYRDQAIIVDFAKPAQPVTVFDVGANIGQSVHKYRAAMPAARIVSFEPLPQAYRELRVVADRDGNVIANAFALHASAGRREFLSNRGGANQTSSFLPPAADIDHSYPGHAFLLEKTLEVDTKTLDGYCQEQAIERIDVLKLDTQGTELDILRGAEQMLTRGAIQMAYVEIVFSQVYEGNPLYHDIAAFMESHGMDLFRIYYMNFGVAGRHVGGDALFVERSLLKRYLDSHVEQAKSA